MRFFDGKLVINKSKSMGISSLLMGESHTNPWNSLLFIGEFHNFLCFFSPFPPVFVAMPCRSQCVAAAAGVAAVSLALLLRRKRKVAKAFPPAKAVEDRGLWMAMAMVRIWVVNAILNPSPIFSHRYYRISGIPIFPIGINMYRLSSHGRFIGFTGLNMKNWWEA